VSRESFNAWEAGLPDGMFSNQKSHFVYISVGLGMENVCIFYGRLEYLTSIWYFVWPFGTFCGQLVYIFRFGMLWQDKSGNHAGKKI
jgi:hypothetical protein